MIVLDTNVLSETLRSDPDAHVLTWLAAQPPYALFTTTVTRGEILYGVRLLPKGRRRDKLERAVLAIFDEDFFERTLAFDESAADAYRDIAAARRRAGRLPGQADAMIAGTARSRGADIATRNVGDFSGCGVNLIDPWHGAGGRS